MNVVASAGRFASYLGDVRKELQKVTWPDAENLRKTTSVIIVVIIILGAIIGLMDWMFSKILIDWLPRLFG